MNLRIRMLDLLESLKKKRRKPAISKLGPGTKSQEPEPPMQMGSGAAIMGGGG